MCILQLKILSEQKSVLYKLISLTSTAMALHVVLFEASPDGVHDPTNSEQPSNYLKAEPNKDAVVLCFRMLDFFFQDLEWKSALADTIDKRVNGIGNAPSNN